jgi:alginate O-acetyltransferase complex protein AlgI
MVFSSASFLFYFLPIVLALYFLFASFGRVRNWILLAASLIFYAWGESTYVLVMLLSILANYFFGIWVYKAHERGSAKAQMGVVIAFNLLLLVIFKYTNFIVANLNLLLSEFGLPQLSIAQVHLPIGISFFTFHCISYLMDIYRRQTPPQMSLPNTALYISLFPQLVAGPIVRYKDIATQLTHRHVDLERFAKGINRFIIGLGKKVLIANALGLPADKIFAIPSAQLTTPVAWLGIICYALQIYFDFSGYSDMAIGLGHMFGFKFMENFNYPYVSRSIQEFWRRWHISLSTWFRDYLYIPLGGNRTGKARMYFNLVMVFFLCGLWHGASWNFVIWGMFHGFFSVIERFPLGKRLTQGPRLVAHVYTLLVVMVAWVFFRAETLPVAMAYLKAMAGFAQGAGTEWRLGLFISPRFIAAFVAAVIGVLPFVPWVKGLRERHLTGVRLGALAVDDGLESLVSLVVLPTVFILCAMSLASGTHNPFIYFQF